MTPSPECGSEEQGEGLELVSLESLVVRIGEQLETLKADKSERLLQIKLEKDI
jgi:hypothetical protein